MGKVSIIRTNNGIKPALIESLDLIGGIKSYLSHTDKVMLKPNLNGTEGITNLELVESLIQLLLDFKVKSVVIAESAFGPAHITDIFFQKTGYIELTKKYGIKLINLNKSKVVEVEVNKPLILDKLKIAKDVFEIDTIINIPVMKVHYATGITLSLKNLKGLLVGDEKRHFHEIGVDKAIVDLNNTIRPSLNIVDCVSCMERMGPRGGDMVILNLIIAGGNRAEVDYIGSKIMDYSLDEVNHLKYYLAENRVDLNQIEVVGEKVDAVKFAFKKSAVRIDNPEKIPGA